jgi:deazaflavin-dependent oxidoreductase (nitroreductase family)
MSFSTPNGTRGGRQPSAEMMRQINARTIASVRQGESGGNVLVLITIGKKSGVERETPVAFFPVKDGSLLIVASAAGAARHPAWYFNLAASPEKARVIVAGQEFAVTAEELHGAVREQAWRQITAMSQGFAQYEQMTDREIPVIRLTRKQPEKTPK